MRLQGSRRGSSSHLRGRRHDPHEGFVPPLSLASTPANAPPTGEAGTGNVIEAVRHARKVYEQIRRASSMNEAELYSYAKELAAPFELLKQVAKAGRLPVVMFSAGGIATPADAAVRSSPFEREGGELIPSPLCSS